MFKDRASCALAVMISAATSSLAVGTPPENARAFTSPAHGPGTSQQEISQEAASKLHPALFRRLVQDDGRVKTWVFFTDKGLSSPAEYHDAIDHVASAYKPRAIERRRLRGNNGRRSGRLFDEHDVAVVQAYVDAVEATGVEVHVTSRWVNAVSVLATREQMERIAELPCVKALQPVARSRRVDYSNAQESGHGPAPAPPTNQPRSIDYGFSTNQLTQINLIAVHDEGYAGDGIIIGILDTGFSRIHVAFNNPDHPLVVVAEYDFVDNDGNTGIEAGDPSDQHRHGTMILGCIGSYLPGSLVGGAFDASFVLCKTEDTTDEYPAEEDNYVAGIEFIEANGADMATSSLGYIDWYTQQDLDGQTAVTTIAVNIATANGLHFCTAAGNQGHDSNPATSNLIAPADAFQVIACGAVNSSGSIAYFSSDGPTADGRVKPELLARGVSTHTVSPNGTSGYTTADGTSLSTPLVACALACLIDAKPYWTVDQMRTNLFETADYYVANGTFDPLYVRGYGVLDALAAYNTGPSPPTAPDLEVSTAVSTPATFTLEAIDDGLPEPAGMTFIVTSLPAHGELSDPANGPITAVPHTLAGGGAQVAYQPELEYYGPDSFGFKANDGGAPPEGGDSNIATVSITVGGPDWDPVAYNMNASTALSTPTDISLWASDPNSDPLTYVVESLPAAGSLADPGAGPIETVPYTLGGGGNLVTYTPPADQYLQEPFNFSVRDATVGSNLATVTVTVGGPMWDPVAYDMQMGTAVSLPTDIALSASDPNSDPLTYFIESLPDAGGLNDPGAGPINSVPYTLVGGGNTVTYTPPFGQTLQTAFDFSVRDATAVSNTATVTVDVGVEHAVYSFLMDANPGWATAGQWAFGQPTGGGTHNGDPTGGHTGNNVYGYNLNGDYENNVPQRYLTTGPIDCTYLANAELQFWRWLGVESSFFDHANIQISTNGLTWATLWEHNGATIDETSWSFRTFDVSGIADGQPTVFLRWGMGPTDSTTTYSGWNLDDIVIWGLDTTPVPLPCDELSYTPADVNLDGTADGADVQTMAQMLLNPAGAWSPEQLCAADFTGDEAVTPADIDAFVLELLN